MHVCVCVYVVIKFQRSCVILAGNTVHYKVTLQPGSEGNSHACMLKFTGTQVGRSVASLEAV